MSYQVIKLTESDITQLYAIEEDHFNDFKAKDIAGKKLSKSVSAFANASGGDIYVGIREENDTKIKHWEGFANIEDANAIIQIVESIVYIENFYEIEFLKHPKFGTYILKISIFKTQAIIKTTDDKIFIRRGAQSLPVDTPEKITKITTR